MSINNSTTNNSNNDGLKYKDFCQALDCYKFAKNEVKLSAGNYGNIVIKVCNECLPLFQKKSINDDDVDGISSSVFRKGL